MDLGMLLKFASLVACVDSELHRNKVSIVFRSRKTSTVLLTHRLICLVKNGSSSILRRSLFLSHFAESRKVLWEFEFNCSGRVEDGQPPE